MNSGPMGMGRKYTFRPHGSKRETCLHLSTLNALGNIMRKLLLATTAFALVGVGSALADGTGDVVITASVTPLCSMSQPSEIDFGADRQVGESEHSYFNINCNFTSDSTVGDLQVSFQSQNGGLYNDAENENRGYSVEYNSDSFTSQMAQAGHQVSASTSTANTDEQQELTVTLDEALDVAGDYSDVLTVSITP